MCSGNAVASAPLSTTSTVRVDELSQNHVLAVCTPQRSQFPMFPDLSTPRTLVPSCALSATLSAISLPGFHQSQAVGSRHSHRGRDNPTTAHRHPLLHISLAVHFRRLSTFRPGDNLAGCPNSITRGACTMLAFILPPSLPFLPCSSLCSCQHPSLGRVAAATVSTDLFCH